MYNEDWFSDVDDADLKAIYRRVEMDEAAHTVSIWNSDKRGTGARRIAFVGRGMSTMIRPLGPGYRARIITDGNQPRMFH